LAIEFIAICRLGKATSARELELTKQITLTFNRVQLSGKDLAPVATNGS
jgi:hypothetical protein